MRTLDLGFKSHIETGATTLANCWRITRGDGVVLGFTDHDLALHFDGTDFDPAHGLDGGEVAAKLGPQVDTAEVVGVLHSAAIGEDDILLGRYDGARVECWRVNWRDCEQRHLLRVSSIGEIVREDGLFRAELRSAQHALNRPSGRLYQVLCDAHVGDVRCGVDLTDSAYRAAASVLAIRDRYRVSLAGVEGYADGWFGLGKALWENGGRQGLTDQVASHSRLAGEDIFAFVEPVGDWVAIGDGLVVSAGCDRQFSICRAKFGNGANFRGFPHIPGNDFTLRYPKKGEALNGDPIFT